LRKQRKRTSQKLIICKVLSRRDDMEAKLARDVRLLKVYAVFITLGCAVLFLTAFQSEKKQKFGEIDAERINIVEPDGRVDMVITDNTHFPPPMWKGKPMEIGR
jgi:hypothetical protein